MRFLTFLLLLVPVFAQAADPYPITVILPLTGNASFLGVSAQKTMTVLEQEVNKQGGIDGRPLRFVFKDDESTPQTTVQLTNAEIAAHPAVFMGSALVAMCGASAPLLKNGPVDYCLSPATHPAPGSYMFSCDTSTTDLIAADLRFLHDRGWTRIASISSTDASGQDFETTISQLLKQPENADIQFVARTRFTMGDVSVGAQMEQLRAAAPQAVIVWTTGAPVATTFKGLVQSGLDLPVVTANLTTVQLEQYAAFLPKELYISSPLYPPHDGLTQYDPRVEAAQKSFYAALTAAHLPIDIMASHVWDPGMIVVATLRKLGPSATAEQVRESIAGLTDFAGVNGLYDFTKVPQRGLDAGSTVVTRWSPAEGRWVVASKPGGLPL
jgi:branched-chain amino acid transport system substrate-binding protein